MPRRRVGWAWAGRIVAGLAVVGLVVYLARVGLDKADKIGSAAGVVVAVLALVAPRLLVPRPRPPAGPGESAAAGSTPVPPGGIDLRGSQGVQVNQGGGTNIQTNTFGSR